MPDPAPAPVNVPLPEGKISLNDPAPAPAPVNNPVPIVELPTDPPAPDPAPVDPPAPDPVDPNAPPADPEDSPEEIATDEDVQAQLEFFQEVDRHHGVEIAVDYGDVLPNSVEGIVIRERAIRADAIARAEQELAQRDPRGAAYLLHRMQGGTDDEFFARKTLSLPDYDVFKDDVDLHKLVYRNDLVRKGLSGEKADTLVEMAVKNGTLFKEADTAYQAQEAEDQKELARLATKAQQEQQAWTTKVNELDTVLNDTIKSKELKLVIPDTEQKDFNAFVRNMVQTDGENFYIAQAIDPKTVPQIIESLYLQFKKGDLSALITRKANTMTVRRNQIQLGNTRKKAEAPPPAPVKQRTTLGDLKFPGEV